MSQTNSARALQRPDVEARTAHRDDEKPTVEGTEVLSLLSDEHAREILSVLAEESLSARALSERLDVSRATVYRRLNRLESAGIIESSMLLDPQGHHRKQFSVVVDSLQLLLGSDGVSLEVTE